MSSLNKILGFAFIIAFVLTVLMAFNKFYIKKDYKFIVEAECFPYSEQCFYRDCSVEGDCPPNNFSEYKVYEISAYDFDKCQSVGCKNECEQGLIQCVQVICGESEGDECIGNNL